MMVPKPLLISLYLTMGLSADPVVPPQGPLKPWQIMRQLDLDKDRKLSLREFSQARRARLLTPKQVEALLRQLDQDGDGFLSIQELRKAQLQRRGRPALSIDEMMDIIDANGDRKITRKEAEGDHWLGRLPKKRRERIFLRLDTNGDGVLSEADNNRTPSYFEKMDRNGDGVLSFQEFQATEQAQKIIRKALAERWEFLDWNQDGVLMETELYKKKEWAPPWSPEDQVDPKQDEGGAERESDKDQAGTATE